MATDQSPSLDLLSIAARIAALEKEFALVRELSPTIATQATTMSPLVTPTGTTPFLPVPVPASKDGDYVAVKDAEQHDAVRLYGGGIARSSLIGHHPSEVSIGGGGYDGSVKVFAKGGVSAGGLFHAPIELDPATRQITVTGSKQPNVVNPIMARITAGGGGCAGVLLLFPDSASSSDSEAKAGLALSSDGTIVFRTKDGAVPLSMGIGTGINVKVKGNNGGIKIEEADLEAKASTKFLPGACVGYSETGKTTFLLSSGAWGTNKFSGMMPQAMMLVGGGGKGGRVAVFDSGATNSLPEGFSPPQGGSDSVASIDLFSDGSMWVGNENKPGKIYVYSSDRLLKQPSVVIDGEAGDIVLQNADCAEDFDLEETAKDVEPGTVMILGAEGRLCPCDHMYDIKVVGVISGAAGYKPALVLDRQPIKPDGPFRKPIALMGKVMCLVDADRGAIKPGDLLTTSQTLGHAMRAEPSLAVRGALIGKALAGLQKGRALVPTLVSLI